MKQRLKEILAEAWNREFYKKHWGYKNLDDESCIIYGMALFVSLALYSYP